MQKNNDDDDYHIYNTCPEQTQKTQHSQELKIENCPNFSFIFPI